MAFSSFCTAFIASAAAGRPAEHIVKNICSPPETQLKFVMNAVLTMPMRAQKTAEPVKTNSALSVKRPFRAVFVVCRFGTRPGGQLP
jgi:hypothetical protein